MNQQAVNISSFALLLLLLLPVFACAQGSVNKYLSLEDAVTTALNNNPEMKNAALQVKRSQLMKTGALEFDPAEFVYQYGQINTPLDDRYMEINQNFGSLLTLISEYKKAGRQIELSVSEMEITKRSLVSRVKSAYYFWWFLHEKYALRQEESLLFNDMQRIAGLRYQLGDFNELEKTMATAGAAEVQNNLSMLSDDIMIAENQLKQLMVTHDTFFPPGESFPMYRIDKPSDTAGFSNFIITEHYRKNYEIMEATVRSERSRFFPEIFAGYFYQDIMPLKGLQGWHAGLSFPLLAFSRSSGIRQAKIDREIALNQLEYMAFSTEMTIENLVAELTKHFRQLQYYNEYGLKQADEIIRSAQLQSQKEDIGYLEYVQSLSQAIAIKQAYLETLNNYNQTAIQLEFYVY